MSQAMRQLLLKDLYLLRWWSLGALAGGLVAAALMTTSALPIGVGGLLLICTLIVLLIFQALGVVQERKDQVALFVLSLPISPTQYVTAKALANLITFGVPWLLLTAAVAVAIRVSPIPDGYLPLWMALMAYFFFYYGALFAVGLTRDSTGWHATAVTVGNISVNFFIMVLFSRPSVVAHGQGATAVWTTEFISLIVVAILGGLAAIVLGIVLFSRRTSYL
jgi:ABC-2 type transport system permease protein